MATVLTPDAAQALDQALTGICSQVGIDPSSARLIKYTMNAVYRAGPFVLRIARGPDAAERADRVTAVAGALTHMETPTIRLARDIGTRPVRHGDWIATVWEHVPTIATEAKPIDLAAPLRAIHRLDDLPVALPAWSPIDKLRRRLDAVRALDPDTADEVDRWALAELGRPFGALLDLLAGRCDQLASGLTAVRWHFPPGVIHADAHTGNVLLRRMPRRAAADPSALLCDLDGVGTGPREWDLVPTAHGATRFGRPTTDYLAFAEAYGFDITDWSGWAVLRDVRELQLVTSVIDTIAGRPDVARQLAHRLRSLLNDDRDAIWTRYR